MKTANVNKTDNLAYKDGFLSCKCGYKHDLGDGFDGYHIDNCPHCTPSLETRTQRKVTYNDKVHTGLRCDIGSNMYFCLSNGINVRYKKQVVSTYNLTRRQANRL